MKNKKIIIISGIFFLFLFIGLFLINFAKPQYETHEKPVRIMVAQEEAGSAYLEYTGLVKPVEIKKYSFKVPGKIKDIPLVQGQEVSPGQLLASLDTQELQMALSASANNLEIARSSWEFARDNYEKMITLKEAGAISAQELDKIRLETENAEIIYKNAQIDYENRSLNLSDSSLTSDTNGYVAEILNEKGELIASGYPVVVVRSRDTEISFGLSSSDLALVNKSHEILVRYNNKEFPGHIKSVSQNPDPYLGTFETKILVDDRPDEKFQPPAGSIVDVCIPWEEEVNIWIPLNIVLNDGQDFVYIMDKEMIVHKRIITINKLNKTMAAVSGLNKNDFVIVEGYRNLRDGDKVGIRE